MRVSGLGLDLEFGVECLGCEAFRLFLATCRVQGLGL